MLVVDREGSNRWGWQWLLTTSPLHNAESGLKTSKPQSVSINGEALEISLFPGSS